MSEQSVNPSSLVKVLVHVLPLDETNPTSLHARSIVVPFNRSRVALRLILLGLLRDYQVPGVYEPRAVHVLRNSYLQAISEASETLPVGATILQDFEGYSVELYVTYLEPVGITDSKS